MLICEKMPLPNKPTKNSQYLYVDRKKTYCQKLEEICDLNKLDIIIDNFDKFKEKFEKPETLLIKLKQYRKLFVNGKCNVRYFQRYFSTHRPTGRKYADKGLSLQSLPRQIRHTIARNIYVDIDTVNSAPTILLNIARVLGCHTPFLYEYVKNRDKILNNSGITKQVYLKYLNGGFNYPNFDMKKVKSPHLRGFIEEMKLIQEEVLLNKETKKYNYEKHKLKRIAEGKQYNHKGSYLNLILCDVENEILDIIYEYFNKPKNAVLCFDGIMLLSQRDDYNLIQCEDYIQSILNFRIKLKFKEMNEFLNLEGLKQKNIFEDLILPSVEGGLNTIQKHFPLWNKDNYVEYDEKYVREYDIDKYDTIICKSRLGSGKTWQLAHTLKKLIWKKIANTLKKLIRKNPNSKVLVCSPRRTFARSITGDLNSFGLPFQCYLDVDNEEINNIPLLVLQMESFHRLKHPRFDVFVMDEVVSCLSQFSSKTTMKSNIENISNNFSSIYKTATKRIICDAFIDPKTLQFVADMEQSITNKKQNMDYYAKYGDLNPFRNVVFYNNVNKPERRVCVEYEKTVDISIDKNGNKIKKINKPVDNLVNKLFETLKQKKKVVFFSASKELVDKIVNSYKELKMDMNKLIVYNSNTGSNLISLSNVNEEWLKADLLIYTSTMTIGTSFTKLHFDELFIYSSCVSSLVRDVFQASKRVRYLKNKILHYALNDKHFDNVSNYSLDLETIKKDLVRIANSEEKIQENMNGKFLFKNAPKWLVNIHSYNILEQNINKRKHRELFDIYLNMNNYHQIDVIPEEITSSRRVKLKKNENYKYADINVKDYHKLKIYKKEMAHKKNLGKPLTKYEKAVKLKYQFLTNDIRNDVDEKTKETIFNDYFTKGHDNIAKFYNIKREFSLTRDYSAGERDQIINNIHQQNVENNNYAEFSNQKLNRLMNMRKFMDIVGLKKSTEIKVLTYENICKISDKILENKDNFYKVFNIRERMKTSDKIKNTRNIINNIIKNWSGYEFRRKERKQKRIYLGKKVKLVNTSSYVINYPMKSNATLDIHNYLI